MMGSRHALGDVECCRPEIGAEGRRVSDLEHLEGLSLSHEAWHHLEGLQEIVSRESGLCRHEQVGEADRHVGQAQAAVDEGGAEEVGQRCQHVSQLREHEEAVGDLVVGQIQAVAVGKGSGAHDRQKCGQPCAAEEPLVHAEQDRESSDLERCRDRSAQRAIQHVAWGPREKRHASGGAAEPQRGGVSRQRHWAARGAEDGRDEERESEHGLQRKQSVRAHQHGPLLLDLGPPRGVLRGLVSPRPERGRQC
mmetsp:Transcript_83732/g.218668  ORF Transcript_83732/g.218668 Transcript_83732/m.218668 type:complete len:251 (+) Transcript_83732:52-804(+)